MADSNDEPDWSLLPHDPARFFGLGSEFDRRDLKRSYNQLIRRFKPERFPQEFQRIRAAYEQLEESIRYGHGADSAEPADGSLQWSIQATASPDGSTFSASSHESKLVVPLHEQIKTGDVSKLYEELRDRTNKSPYDFYALAVLSDVVDRESGRRFADWLLQGLTEYPGEIGLLRLLHAYFRAPIEDQHCEPLLLACSKIVPEGAFFPLTEPLWRTLLRGNDFSRFRDALRKCEANLKGVNIDSRLAFTMQILKPAVWVADAEWIDEAYRFIEANYDRIPSYLDYDLEILARLRAYSRVREKFAQWNEMRAGLDRAMRDYFSEDQLKGDQSVLAIQVLMAQDTEKLGAAFSDFGSELYPAFYAVWMWVSYDVAERHVEPPKQALDENLWNERTRTLLKQIDRQTSTSKLGIKWMTRKLLFWSLQVTVVCLAATFASLCPLIIQSFLPSPYNRKGGEDWVIVAVVVSIVLGVLFGFYANSRLSKRFWQPLNLRLSRDAYRELWQREFFNFLSRSRISYQALRAFVNAAPNTSTNVIWARHYVDQDYALPLFAIAQCFVV